MKAKLARLALQITRKPISDRPVHSIVDLCELGMTNEESALLILYVLLPVRAVRWASFAIIYVNNADAKYLNNYQ